MWKKVVFVILIALCICLLLSLIIRAVVLGVKAVRRHNKIGTVAKIKKTGVQFIISFVVCALFIGFTQITASTPKIRDENGNVPPDSVAKLVKVELNGRNEWISIRGHDTQNPVLLFLAGGPGGTQMAATRYELTELEKHFVVVNWDQPGSGKSYNAIKRSELTPETYIEDGSALTQYLLSEFNQEKIYLVGESWGSALGIFLVDRYPEYYHAFIGTGQMVDFLETENVDYQLALDLAKDDGNNNLVQQLETNGPPPYYGKDVTWKSAAYLNYLSGIMARNPEIQNAGFNTFRDLAVVEYGVLDAINYLRGIVNSFNQVYPQLYATDLRQDYQTLQVPVYFFIGRHDINAPTYLVEEYYEQLNAPHKEIVWFEHSGHNPWMNESDVFVREVLRVANS